MFAGSVYVVLLASFLCPFSLGNAQIFNDRLKQPLTVRDVGIQNIGNALFSFYRSALVEGNFSSVTEKLWFKNSAAQCIKDLYKNETLVQYIDAAGKPQSGLFWFNTLWLGSVSQCEHIPDSHLCTSALYLSIPVISFTLPKGNYILWGTCVPKSCVNTTVVGFLNYYIFPKVKKATQIDLVDLQTICPKKPTYSTGVIVTLVFCGIVLFLCVIGTFVDWVIEVCRETDVEENLITTQNDVPPKDESVVNPPLLSFRNYFDENGATVNPDDNVHLLPPRPSRTSYNLRWSRDIFCDFVLCFSLVRNTKKIFNTDVPSTAITSINGVRVISISWVILGHTFMLFLESPFTVGRREMLFNSKLLSVMPIINGFYSVDSFFFLSGLLVAYTCMRKMQKSDSVLHWIMLYVHRFWRLTPSYMFVILFSVQLKRFLSNGPLWYTQYNDEACSKYWWTNLLYINNFYPKSLGKECIAWSWYLANDMQFFVITPPLLFLLFRFGWRALIVPLVLIIQSSIVIAVILGYYDLDPLASLKLFDQSPELKKKSNEFSNYVYIKPYCRIQPYLIGFILGYILFKNYRHIRKPGWIITFIGWAVAAVVGMCLVYGPRDSTLPGAEQWNKAENILYGTFERLLWGLVLAWVTYACHYNAGGLVQKFLSAKFWIPLSRLTYSVYLIHLIVLPVMLIGAMGTFHYDYYTISYYFISAVVLSYAAGFILAVCIEFPCDNLENVVIKYIRKAFSRR